MSGYFFNIFKNKRVVIGFACLALVPVWYFFTFAEITELPADYRLSLDVDSYDNFYDLELQAYLGEQRSASQFGYEAIAGNSEELQVRNYFNVNTLSGEPIFSVDRIYRIDSHTGKHVGEVDGVTREGYLFAPRMRGLLTQEEDKAPFTYWHVNYNVPILMEYRYSEVIYGQLVYKYESVFTADQTEELTGQLPGVGEDKGIVLDVRMQLWVEPYTGKILRYQDNAEAFYYDLESGKRLYPWNRFQNSISTASVAEYAKEVAVLRRIYFIFEIVIPALFVLVGVFFFLYPALKLLWQLRISKAYLQKHRGVAIAFVVGGIVVLVTWVLTVLVAQLLQQQQKADFENEVNVVNTTIKDRLQIYANAIHSVTGLYNASQEVERDEWKNFIDALAVEEKYPGIQGVGFVKVLRSDEKDFFIENVRSEGFPNFDITPNGVRDFYTTVVYIEPFDLRNQRVFGYDMFSEENRRSAMVYARDTGQTSISRKVTLLQEIDEDVQAGFLMYDAIYKPLKDRMTVEERRENLYGYVYAPFRVNNLMVGIFSEYNTKLGLEIYDGIGSVDDPDSLIYKKNIDQESDVSIVQELRLYNHVWTIKYIAPENYTYDTVRSNVHVFVAIFGGILSVLSFAFVYVLNTRRIRALEMARQMTGELEKFKLAVEGASDHIVITDPTGTILYANPAASRITGFENKEIVGKKPGDLWGGLMSEQFYKTMWDTLRQKKKAFTAEFKNKRKSGEFYYAKSTFTPILSKDGDVEFFVGVERDITREKEIDKSKTEFVSLASHQLRTPLSAINWYAEMLLDGDAGQMNEEQKQYVDEIYKGNKRMVGLVEALLNVSRIDLGTFMVEPEPVKLVDISKSVVKELQPMIQKKAMHIEEHYAELPVVQADPRLTRIIFQNLLSNAVKYTPENGTVSIDVREYKGGSMFDKKQIQADCIGITIADNGYGIPESQHDKIFDKLFRADNVKVKDTEGTGLGLYLVLAIIKEIGGDIWFTSKEDAGTTFFVVLPLSMHKKQGTKRLS